MKFKKTLLIIISLVCILSLVSCSKSNNEISNTQEEQTQSDLKDEPKQSDLKDEQTQSSIKTDNKKPNGSESSVGTNDTKKTDEVQSNNKTETTENYWDYMKIGYYLYKAKPDGSNKVKIQTEPIHDYWMMESTLYYISTDEGANGIELKALYKVDLATGVTKKLSDADTVKLFVIGDDIYFQKSFQIFTIKTDGTGLTRLSKDTESGAILESANADMIQYTYTNSSNNKRMRVFMPTKDNPHQVGGEEEVK